MAVAVAVVVVLVLDAGLNPSVKPVAAPKAAAAVTAVEAGAELVGADPRGLSVKAKPLLAAVVAAVLTDEGGGAPKVKPVAAAAAGADVVVMGEAKRVGPGVGAAWVDAGGAGVVEGLIPKLNPPPWLAGGAAVGAGWGWVRLVGAVVLKLNPPPVGAAVDAAAVVTWTLAAPKLNPPNVRPLDAVVAVAAAGWGWG